MTTLWLKPDQFDQIEAHIRANENIEACGLLLGKDGIVTEVVIAENQAKKPERQYIISPALISQHLPEIIGIYHSHPGGNPLPSEADKSQAWVGGTIYLIVGTKNGIIRYAAWQFDVGRVYSVPVHISSVPPHQSPPLSNTQKMAIIMSTIAALILLVTIALELLPSAPPIP